MEQLGSVTETKKRLYNAATTGIALALGLNIASAFKDMALNMRWPILANRERNLIEVSTAIADLKTKTDCCESSISFCVRIVYQN